MPNEKKCRGCRVRVKIHKWGAWGPSCSGPPPDWGTIPLDTEKLSSNSVVLQHLQLITDRLDSLEKKSSAGATQLEEVSSSDEEVQVEDMTREQLLQYIKNPDVGGVDKPFKKNVRFDEPRKRGLSLSNLFSSSSRFSPVL